MDEEWATEPPLLGRGSKEPGKRRTGPIVEERARSEGMTGIEPALSAWEAEVLPLNYIPALESLGSRLINRSRKWPCIHFGSILKDSLERDGEILS